MAYYFHINKTECCFLIIAIISVIAAEAFNTAIEFICDLVSPDYHILVEKAKDVAAAAVLICAIGAFAIGLLIFLPKIFTLLNVSSPLSSY